MLTLDAADIDPDEIDQRVFVRLGWNAFEQFLKARGDGSANRVTYLDGVLEIMSPSHAHELIKKNIARLLEAWALEADVAITGYGSWTLTQRKKRSGIEPDECYFVGVRGGRGVPDFAIEVVWTHGGLEKLDVYHRLGVREVWVWEGGNLQVHARRASGWVRPSRSGLLRQLDLKLLSRYATVEDQHRALKAFLAAVRRH